MMTSKNSEHTLCSLSFKTTSSYKANLLTLLTLVDMSPKNSIIVLPEVCLTGFDYENWDKVLKFFPYANEEIKKASFGKTIILTIIEKRGEKVFNFAKIFHNGKVVYERAKAKLFRFGGEHNYFSEGDDKDLEIVEVNGVKIAVLICFELRFKDLWQKSEGADIIAVPSWWGAIRSEHFKILTKALALVNQCYLIASDSINEECTKISTVIDPQGKAVYSGNKPCLSLRYDKKEIIKMRRYMDVGLHG